MEKNDRRERVKRIVDKAMQEWRARPKVRKPPGESIPHRIGHGIFEDMPEGTFRAKNSN